jgi:hypothetical protein
MFQETRYNYIPITKELPLESLAFPNCCVHCKDTPETEGKITAESGIDLILIKIWQSADILIPLCSSCKKKRTIAAFIGWPIAVVLGVVLVVALVPLLDILGETNGLLIIMLVFIAYALFIRNRFDQWLDKTFLGIQAKKLFPKEKRVALWFRDAELGIKTEHLTLS